MAADSPSPSLARCRCSRCGVESPLVEFFKTERVAFRRQPRTFCPRCRTARRLNYNRFSLLFLLLALPLLLHVVHLPGRHDPGIYVLANFYLMTCLQIFCTPFHELGHAIAARLVGRKNWRIIIGQGRFVKDFHFLGLRWDVRVHPVGGLAVATRIDGRYSRLEHFIFILGGPLVNAVLATFAWILILPDSPWSFYQFTYSIEPLHMFFWANLVSLANALYPRNVNTAHGRMGNDGRQLLNILRNRLPPRDQLLNALNLRGAAEALATGQIELGFRLLDFVDGESNAKHVENRRGLLLLSTGRLAEAQAVNRAYLQRADLTRYETALARNNVAYVLALGDSPADLPEADRLSQAALADLPWTSYAIGTRGTVLLARRCYAEAEYLLRDSLAQSDSSDSRAQTLAQLALAQAGQGHPKSAHRILASARRSSPHCFIFPIIEKKMAALSPLHHPVPD
jgi:hypothetical protein